MSHIVKKLLELAKNPIVYFCLIILAVSFWKKVSDEGLKYAIRSDSRGYYAYLPSLLIYNDATFTLAHKAEYTYDEDRFQQNHFHITDDGKVFNKYFPGVAVLQSPFFGLATITSFVVGDEITGYSDIFSFFYLLGTFFYFVVGVYFFTYVVKWMYPEIAKARWLIPLIYLSSPLIYFGVFSILSHHYSFAFFGMFFWTLIQIQKSRKLKHIFLMGLILGLIFLIRPTNCLIVLAIPFFIKDKSTAIELLKWTFSNKAFPFFLAFLGSLIGVFMLMLTWKWETGNWLFWAYSGEGFNWTSPKIWQVLFSFRVGLLIHTPILVLAIIGAIWSTRNKSFQTTFWWIYLIVNTYIISSWWCWDYESPFGMRPYTEHWFVLIMPLFALYLKKRLWVTVVLILTSCLGILRMTQQFTLQYTDQRFTASSYFKSLAFWNDYNYQRWNFSRTCLPFGDLQNQWTMIDEKDEKHIVDEFSYTTDLDLKPGRTNSRLYCKVSVDKKMYENDWTDIFIVYDATSKDGSKRYYRSQELYFDKLEGRNEWVHYDSEEIIPDNFDDYNTLKVYIWNKAGKTFEIKNFKVILEEFKKD